jgi:hypothetical protein
MDHERPRQRRNRKPTGASGQQRALQRDHTIHERGGDTSEPERAERALALAQPGDDVHGETSLVTTPVFELVTRRLRKSGMKLGYPGFEQLVNLRG